MILPSTTYKRTLVMEADMLSADPYTDSNDMVDAHVATIDTVTQSPRSARLHIPQP